MLNIVAKFGINIKITFYPPQPRLCDSCKLLFVNDNGAVFICGYAYNPGCYNGKCIYRKEFYKKEVFKNNKSFLKQIEKENDTFTLENLVDNNDYAADNNDVEKETDNGFEEINESLEILTKLTNEINQIDLW
ncbi:hypothetical protein C2G38_2248129 [Gigaspora rosea]|uniref:Uncharacterized protein n=1 Tax=Gigaspora rosea TaxID=44941 RepID=A0A397UY10_9GLOM|nr:hypothetical protein C2G38_2248129 [Gigaspora rosea]